MRLFFFTLTIAALLAQSCFFDPTPPADEDLYDERPALLLRLSGFTASANFKIRFWDGDGAWTYPKSYNFYTDAQGGFLGSISLAKGSTTVSYYLMVDENKSSNWDVGDRTFYRNSLAIDSVSDTALDTVTLAGSSAVVAYAPSQGNPVSGLLICIYFPTTEGSWDTSMANAMPEFPVMHDTTLVLSDWFPVSTKTTVGATTNAFLISGSNYNETCVTDTDNNGIYNTGDTVNTVLVTP